MDAIFHRVGNLMFIAIDRKGKPNKCVVALYEWSCDR